MLFSLMTDFWKKTYCLNQETVDFIHKMFDFVNKPIRRMFNIAFCHHVLKIFETQPLRLSYITEFVKAPERWHPTNYERPLFALQKAFQMAKDGIKMQKRRTTDANNRKRTDTQNLLYPDMGKCFKIRIFVKNGHPPNGSATGPASCDLL